MWSDTSGVPIYQQVIQQNFFCYFVRSKTTLLRKTSDARCLCPQTSRLSTRELVNGQATPDFLHHAMPELAPAAINARRPLTAPHQSSKTCGVWGTGLGLLTRLYPRPAPAATTSDVRAQCLRPIKSDSMLALCRDNKRDC